ncbi:hypothetical protein SLE2022_047390 [Rubroshorea leprosula]
MNLSNAHSILYLLKRQDHVMLSSRNVHHQNVKSNSGNASVKHEILPFPLQICRFPVPKTGPISLLINRMPIADQKSRLMYDYDRTVKCKAYFGEGRKPYLLVFKKETYGTG